MPLDTETLLLPAENDILLNDISELSLKLLEMELETDYTPATCVYPVYGISGSCFRMWIRLVLKRKDSGTCYFDK